MPKFIIEREIPGIGKSTPAEIQAIAQKSNEVLRNLGPQIQWQHSYVAGDMMYCVYIAPDEELIREHAKQGKFPANRVLIVNYIMDPATAEVAVPVM